MRYGPSATMRWLPRGMRLTATTAGLAGSSTRRGCRRPLSEVRRDRRHLALLRRLNEDETQSDRRSRARSRLLAWLSTLRQRARLAPGRIRPRAPCVAQGRQDEVLFP